MFEVDTTGFDITQVHPSNDLLGLIEERVGIDVAKKIPEDTQGWIGELSLLYQMLTSEQLMGSQRREAPHSDPKFISLRPDIYRYLPGSRNSGLWLAKEFTDLDPQGEAITFKGWIKYNLAGHGKVYQNPNYQTTPKDLTPEVFKLNAKLIKNERRPIYNFSLGPTDIFAKGSRIDLSIFYGDEPSHRLTPIAGMDKVSALREMDRFRKLASLGIHTPGIIGAYQTPLEDFLFVEKVPGLEPSAFLNSDLKDLVIIQDAQILAALCILGYRKHGFEDFDDKIFDGEKLHIIDVDELEDLYDIFNLNFRDILLDPRDADKVKKFRELQKELFRQKLRDTIYRYQSTLTQTREEKALYIHSFYNKIGWRTPTEAAVRKLVTFPKNYLTFESSVAMSMGD